MLRVTSTYDRPRLNVRIDRLTDKAEPKLSQKANELAQMLIDETRAELDAITPADKSEATAIKVFRDSLHNVNGSREFKRRKFVRGSLRPVVLVSTRPGAAVSAFRIEFGEGAMFGGRQYRPMASAVYKLRGSVY